jgi:hypothetical protein
MGVRPSSVSSRWTYRVHEQILPALRRAKIPVRWTDLTVRHTGYVDRALRDRKLDRDARILNAKLNGLAEFRDVQRIGDPYQPEAPALMSGSFRAPRRGNDKTALGNAQGTMATPGPAALKGRNKVNRLSRPFRAWSCFGVCPTPQGVALGFHVEPRWGRIKDSATSKRARRVRIRRRDGGQTRRDGGQTK